jgi:hypothetical protein
MDPERDVLVPIATADPQLLADAQKHHKDLETTYHLPNRRLLMDLGETLFQLAFPTKEAVEDLAQRLAVAAQAPGTRPLRLWLHATDPELALLPWEYLCLTGPAVTACRRAGLKLDKCEPNTTNPSPESFLALHPTITLVRSAQTEPRQGRLERLGKLKVLVAWANPGPCEDGSGWGNIDGLAREVEAIGKALGDVGLRPLVEWKVLEQVNRASLQRELADWKPHVLHFAGHGAIPGGADDPGDLAEPALVLELKKPTPKRRHDYLNAEELRDWCAQAGTLLVVLNACWGARTGRNFAGIAQVLVAGEPGPGVPVVVAHQFPILQTNAVGFPLPFYDNVARALSIEEAVSTVRHDLVRNRDHGHFDPSWGVPVVFLGVQDSQLFRTVQVDPYPTHFRPLLQQYEDQVPRPFLQKKVAAFLAERPSGIFHLIAAPGTGKTAFLARWVQDDPSVVHAFYRAPEYTNPDHCINALYDGLRGRHGLVEEKRGEPTAGPRRRLDRTLELVSADCQRRGRKEVILIDALDEAGRSPSDQKSAAEVLPGRGELPPHVYLLVTSRPGPEADKLSGRPDVEQYVLDQDNPELQGDLPVFAAAQLAGRVTDAGGEAIARLSADLAARVRANFLVLKCFLHRVLKNGPVSLQVLEAEARDLTDSVEAEYQTYFERLRHALPAGEMASTFAMLGAFAFACSPITEGMACAAFALPSWEWYTGFNRVCQFLERSSLRQAEGGAQPYRLFHQTFQEYLARTLASDRAAAQRAWAEYCLGWRKLKDYPRLYALRHLPRHLLEASKES